MQRQNERDEFTRQRGEIYIYISNHFSPCIFNDMTALWASWLVKAGKAQVEHN